MADPERVGAQVGLDEQRMVEVLRAQRPLVVEFGVQRFLDILRNEPRNMLSALGPGLDPGTPIGESNVERRQSTR